MSAELGKKAINEIIARVLKNSPILKALNTNYRSELNSQYHILDLSHAALSANKGKRRSQEIFDKAYNEFISTIKAKENIQKYTSLNDLTSIPKGTTFIQNPPMLINISFDAARTSVTEISNLIKKNPYFGTSNRVRGLNELISEGYSLEELQKEGRFFNAAGKELIAEGSKRLRKRVLSKVDLGHTPGAEQGRNSPLGETFLNALDVDDSLSVENFKDIDFISDEHSLDLTSANQTISALVIQKMQALTEIQAKCDYTYKNEYPEKLASLTGNKGFLILTLQLYSLNNDISKQESRLRNELISEIKAEIRKVIMDIPGSNTLKEDVAVAIKQEITRGIKGTSTKVTLPVHSLITGELLNKSTQTKTPKQNTSSVKIKTEAGKPPKAAPLRTQSGQFYSLNALRQLINAHLQNVISANMGDGSSRNILNYRTGRFASTVQVESLSQSRDGMITAFYSYMQNPYATFSQGGRQEFPKSRDPKLLIAKSIREIAAEKVTNRMRAVLV